MKCQSGIRALCRILSRVCSEAHTVNGQQSIEACGLFHSACQKAFAPKFEHFGAAFALGPNSYQTRGVKTAVLDLKRGNVVMWNGKPASVVKVIHTKGLARQLGNVDLELKDLASGTKIAAKMKPNEAVDEVQVESQEVQVLYKDDEGIHVMSGSTFEQSVVEDSLLGEPACKLVQDGAVIRLVVFEGRVVSASAPERVSVKVVKTASPIKGKTGFKQAEVEGGALVEVPMYISEGETIEVRTADGTFAKRGE